MIESRVREMRASAPNTEWLDRVTFSFGYILPADLPLAKDSPEPFRTLVEKYYDPSLENRHSAVSGVDST